MNAVTAREMPAPVKTKVMGDRDELKKTSLSPRQRGLRTQRILIGVDVKRRPKRMIAQGLAAAADKPRRVGSVKTENMLEKVFAVPGFPKTCQLRETGLVKANPAAGASALDPNQLGHFDPDDLGGFEVVRDRDRFLAEAASRRTRPKT